MKTSISLLSDQQMKSFIQDGYIKLAPNYPPELHEKIYREIEQMLSKNGNLGNNILPLIPDIQKIFDHPLVRGALTGVLGVNYVMHSHRFCHFNVPGSVGQDFHKDSYEGDISANNHRCRWAMAFYYPQHTPKKIGRSAGRTERCIVVDDPLQCCPPRSRARGLSSDSSAVHTSCRLHWTPLGRAAEKHSRRPSKYVTSNSSRLLSVCAF